MGRPRYSVYHQLSNQNNTWECARPRLRALGQAPFTAFEMAGVKFIGWDTATPQDPRPSIATEGLRRLQMEFARTPVTQPVIFYCHHPLDGREFAGEYDRARLLDLLATRNVVLMLVGHGHGVRAWTVGGIDTAMGGSSWGDRRGYGIVSIRDGILRVAYRRLTGADELTPLLEKPLVEEAPRLEALTVAPPDGTILTPEAADAWSLRVRSEDGVIEGRWTLDGEATGPLTREGELWVARPVLEAPLEPGAHVIRLEVTPHGPAPGGPCASSSRADRWHRLVAAARRDRAGRAGARGRPASRRANDGTLTALEAASGGTSGTLLPMAGARRPGGRSGHRAGLHGLGRRFGARIRPRGRGAVAGRPRFSDLRHAAADRRTAILPDGRGRDRRAGGG